MGGFGSGRERRYKARATTDDCVRVDVNEVNRAGGISRRVPALVWGHVVGVTWTRCALGGKRPWFLCPECDGRRGVLYASGGRLACRGCLGLAYPSQHQSPRARAFAKAKKLRARLGDDGAIGRPLPPCPKGMHARTYRRLRAKAIEADARALSFVGAWVDRQLSALRLLELQAPALP